MTVKERVLETLNVVDMDCDSYEKLIAMAYYMGRERATREICDKHNARMKKIKERAKSCRYWKMAEKVLGEEAGEIYSADYAGDMTETFADDETEL